MADTQSNANPVEHYSHHVMASTVATSAAHNHSQVSSSVRTERTVAAATSPPQVLLTFLLVSGLRRTLAFDPSTTIGRVKELVWNAWPPEWTTEQDRQPPSPSYLRILHLGKILQDESTLASLNMPIVTPTAESSTAAHAPPATIVHLSIRAFVTSPDDIPKSKRRRRGANNTDVTVSGGDDEESAGCCAGCVIA